MAKILVSDRESPCKRFNLVRYGIGNNYARALVLWDESGLLFRYVSIPIALSVLSIGKLFRRNC